MNIRTRILLATFAITAPLLNPAAHAFGGPPGGPYSNGSYFPNDGTFSAVMRKRSQNLVGILQFSTSSGSGPVPSSVEQQTTNTGSSTTQATITSSGLGGVGSTGVATIYYNGKTLQGNCQGSINPTSSSMQISFQASAQGQGEQTIEVQTPITVDVPNVITEGGETTVITTQETEYVPTRKILFFDSLYISGSGDCKTSNAFPNQKFQGQGQAEYKFLIFTGNTPVPDSEVINNIQISGVRLSNTASTFNVSQVRAPSVAEFSVLVE
jgi:hypothetical protein